MKIVLFHPVLLPARDYGGVERVVLWLARGLIERGHQVWVAALRGSRLPQGVALIELEDAGVETAEVVRRLPPGVDLVHFMAPPGERNWELFPCARILTVHGNGKVNEVFPLNSVFLSADHARRHGASTFVHNGIDPEELRFDPKASRDSWLFLSKTSWRVKNLRGTMRMCRKAHARLSIAGGNRPFGLRMSAFATPGFRWLGPVSGSKKADVLALARGLIFPVSWPEPFGLVVVEALMSGTPVLASRNGSLPELLTEKTGVLLPPPVDCESEMAWLPWLRKERLPFDPGECREHALRHFHYSHMAAGYENLYKKVGAGEGLHTASPVARDWRSE